MKNCLLNLKRTCGKKVKRYLRSQRRKYKEAIYSRYPRNHIFHICVDETAFQMTFLDYRLDYAIIERIEGLREPVTTAVIKSLVQRGSRVLEIGGCYGYFTAIMAQCAGEEGRVVSVEGTPNNYNILRENIRINNFSRVECYNFFIAAGPDQILFDEGDTSPYKAMERLQQKEDSLERSVKVPVRTITAFLKEIDFSPDYIFMDIEGYEADIFADFLAQKYLQHHRPVIVFELHPDYYRPEKDLVYIERILTDHNYTFRKIATNYICFPQQNINRNKNLFSNVVHSFSQSPSPD